MITVLGSKIKKAVCTVLSVVMFSAVIPVTGAETTNKKYMHISFDDVYSCMADITENDNTYSSVFDNSFFADLKYFNEQYGAVFTLNCFMEAPGYNISNVTDKYKTELSENSNWLKFAFHAKDSKAKYTTDSVNSIKEQYKKFTDTIIRIADTHSIDAVTRLGFFTGSINNMKALKSCEYGITGFLTADDDRTDNYYLNASDRSYVAENNFWYDEENDLLAIHTQKRLENVTDTDTELNTIGTIDNNGTTMIEIFTHESEYERDKTDKYIKWALENGYSFDFAQNHIEELKTQQSQNPRSTDEPLPDIPDKADLEWDFSKYTSKVSGTSEGFIEDYDGLKIYLASTQDYIEAKNDISPNGLYWKTKDSRYVNYTPTADGIIVIQIKSKSEEGAMKLTDSSGTTLAVGNSEKDGYIIYRECKANETYSIVPTGNYQRIRDIKYYKTGDDTVPSPSPTPDIPTEPTSKPTTEPTIEPTNPSKEDDNGIYDWDFSNYTEKITTTEADFTESYDGLTIAIANNSDDSISAGGVYWRGGGEAKDGDSPRYIAYTPTEDGTLYATGKLNASGGRWGIHTSRDYSFSADNSTTSTSVQTVSMTCKAGKTYYIYSRTRSATVSNIRYVTSHATLTALAMLNNMYGDNMLLQRDKSFKLDGFAENADSVILTIINNNDENDKQTREATVKDGVWNTEFDAISNYTDTYTLILLPKSNNEQTICEEKQIENIKFGDLYLCGGQSNMWYYLSRYIGIDYTAEEIANCADNDIRVLQLPTPDENNEAINRTQPQTKLSIDGIWRELDSDFANKYYLPATVYSLAVKLHSETDVPIGILSTAVGNTYISQWRENTGSDDNNSKRNWYNSRIYPFHNMAIKGIFWYQGCNDRNNGSEYYEKAMTGLIKEYRMLFGQSDLPFYYVQLTRNGNVYPDTVSNKNDDTSGMRDVRRAQTDVYLNMKDKTNLGFISTLDIYGEKEYKSGKNSNFSARVNYHTAQKPVIANRLADLALKDIYNKNTHKDGTAVYTHGPLYKWVFIM